MFQKPALALTSLFVGWALFMPASEAFSSVNSYIPPEILSADALGQRIQLENQLNINQISLNQLKILPGINEDLALKIMRTRPMSTIQDFYKLPNVPPKEIQNLIQQLQPRIIFK